MVESVVEGAVSSNVVVSGNMATGQTMLMSINYFQQYFQQWKIHFWQAWLKRSIWLHKSITGYYFESKLLTFDSDMFLISHPFARLRPSGITVYIQLCSKPKHFTHMASTFNTRELELQKLKLGNTQKTQPNNYLNLDIIHYSIPSKSFHFQRQHPSTAC